MINKSLNITLLLIVFMSLNKAVYSESLYRASSQDNIYISQPKSLFGTVRAKNIGDIVTIKINESVATSDSSSYSNSDASSVTDNFRALWNKILPINLIPSGINGFGGSSTVNKKAGSTRATTLKDTITAQVVQVLPNGNLLVQGKKTAVNAKERIEVVISGIVDPRLLDGQGSIDSTLVANFQVAVTGKGDVSASATESPIIKYIRYLF